MFEGLKVLYLEDEPLVAFDTGEHLETLGFDEVAVAYRLSKAESLASDTEFDVAILDINVDNGQTSLKLGNDLASAGTCVIFASGNSSAAPELQSQGFAFLDKPFSLEILTQKLKSVASPG